MKLQIKNDKFFLLRRIYLHINDSPTKKTRGFLYEIDFTVFYEIILQKIELNPHEFHLKVLWRRPSMFGS